MKNSIKIFTLAALAGMLACEDPETPKPVPATEPSEFSAKFLFVNATPDAPALNFYVNNVETANGIAAGQTQTGYSTVDLTSNAVIANTNLRATAGTNDIGGTLGANDLIYRAGNNNANNFTATNGFMYTVIALDSINRPQPIRTLNTKNVGDITYFSYRDTFTAPKLLSAGDTTIYLNVQTFFEDSEPSKQYASANSVIAFNWVKKYNGGVNPSFMVPVGTVPLGSSDVGGPRFVLIRDFFPTYAPADLTTRAGFRTVNAVSNGGSLKLVLKLTAGTGSDIALNGAGSPYIVGTGTQNPSVGSYTPAVSGANFTLQTTSPGGVANTYTIELRTAADVVLASQAGVMFTPGTNYTIVASGFLGGTGAEAPKVILVTHL